ncbi:MAG: cytochrome c3 family protein [Candidatus Methanoperedens sp.]|nr:cytochrome c3 family protein [Candidatus Methanoperedens sp.]
MINKNVSKIIIGIAFVFLIFQAMQPVEAKAPDMPNNSCADCHRKMPAEDGISNTYGKWAISTHALFEVTCEKCHGGDPLMVSKEDAHKNISKEAILNENTPAMCGKCHEPELNEFKGSQHYKKLESGQSGPAPACITCHQKHTVRVLTSSELMDFCISCHNIDTGINPSVPGKAKKALESLKELQFEISIARGAVISAKENGKDVRSAEIDLEEARTILKSAPSVWHRFNLTYFDTEVQKGIENAKNAEKLLAGATATQTPPAKSPGFGIFTLMSVMIIIYFIKRH